MSRFEALFAIFAIGMLSGLRSFSPIAVICWLAMLHRLPVVGWVSFAASKIAVVLFSLAALGELIADKLPKMPSRLQQPGFGVRILMGALCAAVLDSNGPFTSIAAMLLGAAGAVLGSYLGYFVRSRTTAKLDLPDLPVALVEDLICIAGSIIVASPFAPL